MLHLVLKKKKGKSCSGGKRPLKKGKMHVRAARTIATTSNS